MGSISTGARGTRRLWGTGRLPGIALAAGLVLAACGGDDDDDRSTASASTDAPHEAELITSDGTLVSEDELPVGFEKTPAATVLGQELVFDDIPGHYWKVLDDGFAIGLHFQSDEPFAWAKDVPTGELLYIVYAIPGKCPNANFDQSLEDPDASVVGTPPPGFDHWHGMVGGGADIGHWLTHIAVRDFTFAGMEGNPMEGMEVKAGNAGFMPVCEPR